MVTLRNITFDDLEVLQKHGYQNMTYEDIQKMISQWNQKEYQGKYFEMFAIVVGVDVVGTISLFQHSESVISCGTEVFECYRKNGFGKESMILALQIAKQKGYKIVSQQIRKNNEASIALHRSIGFESNEYAYVNEKGNEVFVYLKALF